MPTGWTRLIVGLLLACGALRALLVLLLLQPDAPAAAAARPACEGPDCGFASDGSSFLADGGAKAPGHLGGQQRVRSLARAAAAALPCDFARDAGDAWPPSSPGVRANLTSSWRAMRDWGTEESFLRFVEGWRQPLSTFLRDPWLKLVSKAGELVDHPVEVPFSEYLSVLEATGRNVFLFLRHQAPERDDVAPSAKEEQRRRFFALLSSAYSAPEGFADQLRIFAMDGVATGHGMHRHKEAWLAQVAGRKVWWTMPPSASEEEVNGDGRPVFPYKALSYEEGSWPCAWLLREELAPPSALRCVQQPGEVVVLPSGWWHMTCSLDRFNVAVGGQGV